MKIHLASLRAAAALAAVLGVHQLPASAQFLPYQPAPQAQAPYGVYPTTAPQAPAAQTPYMPYQPQQQPLAQQQQPAPARYPAVAQNPYAGLPPQHYAATPQTGYPALAQNSPAPTMSNLTPPQNPVPPGQVESLPTPAGSMPMSGSPAMSGEALHPGHTHPHTNGYPSTSPYGAYAGGNCNDYGLSGYFNEPCGPTNQWFGGIYFLYMERDNNSFQRVTIQADPPTDPYYPPAATTILSTDNVDYQYREGIELRFGSTFTVGGAADACSPYGYGCNSCGPAQLYAWEVALWTIDRDVDWFTVTDANMTDTYRIYGMVNYAGLEYDDGGGFRPVNEYYDYQMPIVDDNPPVGGDYRVYRQRVRTNFSASNAELNFLRIPVCSSPCSTGYDNCGGYNACSSGYGAGCQTAAACDSCGPSFSMAAMCGLRYFRVDDDFEHAVDAYTYNGAAWVDTTYQWDMFSDYNLDNQLFGFQLGVNMNYCVASRWNFFCDTAFGLYNNHISQYARVYGPAGPAYETQSGREATIDNDKDDIAFLGEMRLGGAYDLTCNCRAVLAYRAVAISGVALATEQINPEMSNWAESSRIDSNGSIIIHGVQAGVECRY